MLFEPFEMKLRKTYDDKLVILDIGFVICAKTKVCDNEE